MVDTTDNGFRAAIQSLREIILPAIDPAHPLASEQAKLIIDWLEFQRSRIPVLLDRQLAELATAISMAEAIQALGLPLEGCGLDDGTAIACDAQNVGTTNLGEVQHAVTTLETALSKVVQRARDLPAADRRAVEQIIIKGSEPVIAIQRSWFLPYRLEADPSSIPSLEDAFAAATASFGSAHPMETQK